MGNQIRDEIFNSNERFKRLSLYSGLPLGTFSTHKLMTFLPGKGTDDAYKAVLNYITDKTREHLFLTLTGQCGRGKTHLALGIGWFWLENEKGTVKYWQVGQLLEEMRQEYSNPPKTEYGELLPTSFETAKHVELLILDDLGAEKQTDWAVEKLDALINYRYIEAKPTVFTTNLSAEQLPPRVASRLKEGIVVFLRGEDYRQIIARRRQSASTGEKNED